MRARFLLPMLLDKVSFHVPKKIDLWDLHPNDYFMMMKVYQLIGDIKLEFDDSHVTFAEETYYRELDLDTANSKSKIF
jgi:hypothetical protein